MSESDSEHETSQLPNPYYITEKKIIQTTYCQIKTLMDASMKLTAFWDKT
jgi:hypothetical protein